LLKETQRAGVQNAAKPARGPSHSLAENSTGGGGGGSTIIKRRKGEVRRGSIQEVANTDNSISTRRATSVPVEKSENTVRREHVSPLSPLKGINYILTSSPEGGMPYQPGDKGRL